MAFMTAVMSIFILTLTGLLECLDFVLVIVQYISNEGKLLIGAASPSSSEKGMLISTPDAKQKKRPIVAIIGGSFAGLACARKLCRDCDVVLIDKKRYFEYTPGVLRLFVDPSYHKNLTAPLDTLKGVRFVQGAAVGVRDWSVSVLSPDAESVEEIVCDAAIIACGSTYGGGVKASDVESRVEDRIKMWEATAQKLLAAKSVLVIGGGAVGVELAAEIAVAYPLKSIIIVDSRATLCEKFAHPKSSAYIMRWFRSQPNVELVLNSRIASSTEWVGGSIRTYTLESGRRILADVAYDCRGAAPNTKDLAQSLQGSLTDAGHVCVGSTFQVSGHQRVFALGDVAHMQGGARPCLGHTAEFQALTVSQNVLRVCQGMTMCRPEATVYSISLGAADATLRVGPVFLSGFLAAVIKWGIEWSKVAQFRQRPIGIALWKLSDLIMYNTVDSISMPVFPRDEGKGTSRRLRME